MRKAQLYCSRKCRVADAVDRHRSDYKKAGGTPAPEKRLQAPGDWPAGFSDGPTMVWSERDTHHGPTPGALQGDDYPLEYYPDGYPKLPACLDRRRKPGEPLAEAAVESRPGARLAEEGSQTPGLTSQGSSEPADWLPTKQSDSSVMFHEKAARRPLARDSTGPGLTILKTLAENG